VENGDRIARRDSAGAIGLDLGAQRGSRGADHLCHRARTIAAPDAVDAAQRPHETRAFACGVSAGDAEDRRAAHQEHETEVRDGGKVAAEQALDGATMGRDRGRRQHGGC